MTALWVTLGALLGAPLRYLTSRLLDHTAGTWLPWGTLVVNVLGSLLLGGVLGAQSDPAVVALVGTGFCGALTTYSTLSYETWQLIESRATGRAVIHVVANVMIGFAAAAIGWSIAKA